MKKHTIAITEIKQVINRELELEIDQIRSPKEASDLAYSIIGDSDREHFLVISLSTKNRVNNIEIAHVGTLNTCVTSPRDILKGAILANAAAIILVHNHPSMDLKPSEEDIQFTRRMIDAGQTIGIEMLDHVIINQNNEYYSMKEFNFVV